MIDQAEDPCNALIESTYLSLPEGPETRDLMVQDSDLG